MHKISRYLVLCSIFFVMLFSAYCRTADTSREIDQIFEQFDSRETPGAAVAVIRDDEIVFKKAYGMASLELDVPATTKTLFRIGSVSKQFTAACVYMLALEGKLALNDPVTKYFPELPEAVYGPATIDHMIHHSSGIRDSEALYPYMGIEYAQWYTHSMLLEMLARQKSLSFTPGEMLEYSNSAFTLLALIVEKAAGKPFNEFIRERIFDPLGMDSTRIQTSDGTFIPHRSAGYRKGPTGYLNWMTNNQLIGHDAVYSSVEDMTKWAAAFQNGGLDPRVVEMMTSLSTFNDGRLNSYCGGIIVSHYKGLPTWDHSGWYVGYTAYLVTFPEQNLSIVSLSNSVSGSRERECLKIAEIFLADEITESLAGLRASPKNIDANLLKGLDGDYMEDCYARLFPLEMNDGLPRPKGADWSFEPSPFHPNEFVQYDNRLTLRIVSNDGKGDAVIDYMSPMARIGLFKKMGEALSEPPDPSPILGEYWSDEIQAAARISEEEGKLTLNISLVDGELNYLGPNLYRTRSGKLEFFHNADSLIAGFAYSTYGFQGVIFQKTRPSK
jgi:CubicO group peptidase (beta-lactamase class C family)